MFPFFAHFAPVARPLAYLDPGSGSIILQMLLAVLLGAGFIIKSYWSKIKAIFTGGKGSEEAPVDEKQPENEQ